MNALEKPVDIQDVKNKLYERLKPSGWGDKLKTFLLSDDMDKILNELLKEAREGKRFTPVLKQVFRAFEECPYKDLKVVMLLQDPYPQNGPPGSILPVADGIAMSCSNTGKPEASLRYVFKELEETIYKEEGYTWDPDLKRWSNQGVLMINTALTTTIGKVGSHYNMWRPFLAFLFDILSFQNSGLVYVFLGKKSQEWADSIPESNYKLFTSHPASAAYQGAERWDSQDVFNKINQLCKKQWNEEITW